MGNKKVSVTLGNFGSVLLTIVFFVAKILGYIEWSWVMVFCPLWIGWAVAIILIVFYLLLSLIEKIRN